MSLNLLEEIDQYRKLFFDSDFWKPYVHIACEQVGLTCGEIRSGIAGTYPVFIIDDRYVVKFFGRLFDGEKAYQAELYAFQLAHTVQGFPLPDLIARGQLLKRSQGWSWPFLIYEYLPGMTIGEAWNQLTDSMKLDLAANLGQLIRQLHATPLIPGLYFSPDWAPFIYFLELQRRTCRTRLQDSGCIPDHFLNQINSYLLPIEQLVDPECSPHLVHADLTRDHLLGYINAGRWKISGLIDFGDARVGNLYYELVALHFDLFQRDKMMLQRFVESYQTGQKILENFPAKAMNMLLLHEFGAEILHDLFIIVPELAEFDTLESLAECLWSINFRNHKASAGF